MRRNTGFLVVATLGFFPLACGPTAPPPAAPTSAAPAAPPAASTPPVAGAAPTAEAPQAQPGTSSGAASEPADTAKPADAATEAPAEAPPSAPEIQRSAVDMITARDLAFLIDYASSDAKQRAETACEKPMAEDPEKGRACIAKAREQFQPDVIRFAKDAAGHLSWKVYKRRGEALSELFVAAVDLRDDSATSVRVKLTGKATGQQPLFKGKREFTLSVPNEYSIELEDPALGKLVYSAKIGLVSD